MDEADLVLNKAEKGLLNIIFESLKTPVIWITNNIAMIENSTRRRFDYSLEFFSFSKSERIAIWQSVLKTQQAESMMRSEEIECVAKEIPVMAGSATLAVRLAQRMQSQDMPPLNVVREVASSHAKLLGISTLPQESRPDYNLDCVRISSGDIRNIDYVVPMLKNFDAHWKDSKATGRRESLNIFLYGPPGTGKSAFARHIAHDVLCREIIVKRASDILGCHVGESEHNVSAMFREAERSDAILFIDEADSFFENRGNAKNHWEVTLVNEFICQMDSFNGMLIAATNYENVLDWAIRRRFQLKLSFDRADCVWKLVSDSMEQSSLLLPDELRALVELTKTRGSFTGSNTELARAVSAHSGTSVPAKGLKQLMNRWQSRLEREGVKFRSYRSNGQRMVVILFSPAVGGDASDGSDAGTAGGAFSVPCDPATTETEARL